MLVAVVAWLSSFVVSGRVRDAATREPLEGVTVQVVGTTQGTVTDRRGQFRVEAADAMRLRFVRIGYVATELSIRGDSALEVLLVPAAQALEGVTVTALRGEGSASSAAPIAQHTVEKEELEKRYSGQEVPLLLSATPSITSYADAGSYSNYTYLRLRGIDQTRINITLDGVPLADAEDEAVYFSNFPDFANSLQSVQVQRGVGTSSYGNASYAGALNFQSITLSRSERSGEIQLSRGSYNTNRGSAEWQSGTLGDRFAAYGRLSSQQTDGYRHHAGNRSAGGFVSGGYFGRRSSVKLTAFTGVSRNQESYLASPINAIRRDPRDNPLSESERDRFTHTLMSLALTRLVGSAATVSVTAYTVNAGGDYDVAIGTDLWNFNLKSRVSGGFVTWNQQRGPFTLSIGAHGSTYYRDHWLYIRPDLQSQIYLNTGHKEEASVFVKGSVNLGRLTLFADGQTRRAWYEYDPDRNAGITEESIYWTFFNPKLGATYRIQDALSVYASAGSNGREPSRNDMFAGFDNVDTSNVDFIGPLTRVRPERVRDVEMGVVLRTPELTLNANLFAMAFRNEITPIGALSYIGLPLRKNVRSSFRRGLEVEATYRGIRHLTLSGNATISRNRIREYTDDATGVTYFDVEPLLTPKFISNQRAELELIRNLSVLVDGRYLSRAFLANTSDPRFVTPRAHAIDAGLNWHVGSTTVLAQVRNLSNARVYTGGYVTAQDAGGEVVSVPAYYVLAARNAIVTARLAF